MVSIVQRGKSHSVVYSVNGKQKWETFKSNTLAQARKIEIEYQQSTGTFVPPNPTTIRESLEEFVNLYGATKWAFSTYRCNTGLIHNYIHPLIGDWKLKDLTVKKMDTFLNNLKSTKAVQQKGRATSGFVSDRVIYDVHALLQSAFSLAVSWEYIGKNPMTKTARPELQKGKQEAWEPDVAKKAISLCDNRLLLTCLHIALACTMRIGEILGLRWSFVDFGDVENNFAGAKLFVEAELQRISLEAFKKLERKMDQIKLVFPAIKKNGTTKLVLKLPKTESSIRCIWIPSTVAAYLWQLKKEQGELKALVGDAYEDFDVVGAQSNGRPVELRLIEESFKKLITDNNLPMVDFHSLRHTSTTYKLMLCNGDIKSVQGQGETGHAQAAMVTEVYSHIWDMERQQITTLFEEQ